MGIWFAVLSALMASVNSALLKRYRYEPLWLAWISSLSTFLAVSLWLLVTGEGRWTQGMVFPLVGSLLLNALAIYLYITAISIEDLSLVIPISTLGPVITLVTGPLINREIPSWWGVLGVLVSSLGAYKLLMDGRWKRRGSG